MKLKRPQDTKWYWLKQNFYQEKNEQIITIKTTNHHSLEPIKRKTKQLSIKVTNYHSSEQSPVSVTSSLYPTTNLLLLSFPPFQQLLGSQFLRCHLGQLWGGYCSLENLAKQSSVFGIPSVEQNAPVTGLVLHPHILETEICKYKHQLFHQNTETQTPIGLDSLCVDVETTNKANTWRWTKNVYYLKRWVYILVITPKYTLGQNDRNKKMNRKRKNSPELTDSQRMHWVEQWNSKIEINYTWNYITVLKLSTY